MSTPTPAEQLSYFRKQQREILDTIQQLVEIESPSDVKAAVDRLGTVIASRFGELGAKVRVHRAEKSGDHLQISFPSPRARATPVLLLGHMDTVYSIGTISKMPFRVAKGRVFGPGVADMKAGIALAFHVAEALLQWGNGKLSRPVTLLLVSDEEVGSASSRKVTEQLAGGCAGVLVLEPAAGRDGAVKTARKGVGGYELRVEGRAAHAGLDFERGQNAVVELARLICAISELVDVQRGITINVGKVSGGTRVNVVPAEASAAFDVRVRTQQDAIELHRKLTSLKPFNANCKLTITGSVNRPPMERKDGVIALYEKARAIARELGWDLEEAAVGGGSDGNFTAALGIPTLDGLGAVGGGAHSPDEFIEVSELPRRAALLAGLIERL
ncbi:MAG TPA: M20 family metallopeptidase [Terriglobales bacterium]